MWSGRSDNVSRAEGSGGQVATGGLKSGQNVVKLNIQNGWSIELSSVEDLPNVHLVLKGTDLELLKECGLRLVHLLAFLDNFHWVRDFDLSLHDLGLDRQSLEELGLLGVKTSRAGLDGDIRRGNHASLGGGLSCLLVQQRLNLREVSVREDHTYIALQLLNDKGEMGTFNPTSLSLLVIGGAWGGFFIKIVDGLLHVSLATWK